jgi:hypothetical protein
VLPVKNYPNHQGRDRQTRRTSLRVAHPLSTRMVSVPPFTPSITSVSSRSPIITVRRGSSLRTEGMVDTCGWQVSRTSWGALPTSVRGVMRHTQANQPLLVKSFCMRHSVIWCASLVAIIDRTRA